jgi:hypothetical protein
MGAETVAGIASIFGYSKPSEISNAGFMRNTPNYSMATADGSDMVQKLSLNRKQEITVDPVTVGLSDCEDTMAIAKIASIESYITDFEWSPAETTPDTWLFSIAVTPTQYLNITTGGGVDGIVPTACCYASRPFKYWSGTMKFRFKIIASAFTRGRLAFVYDPNSISNTTLDTYNTNFLAMVDISETKDFTIEVPWMQSEPYKPTTDTGALFVSDGSQLSTTSSNGVLGVRIVNDLVQPDGTTPVKIAVFVSAGDDFETVNPIGILPKEGFTAASATVTDAPMEDAPEEGDTSITLGSESNAIDHKALVFFGERIGSFREFIKRYSYHRVMNVSNPDLTTAMKTFQMASFPAYRRSDSNVPSNMLQYVCASHAAWRGSVRYKINAQSDGVFQMFVDRETNITGPVFTFVGTSLLPSNSSGDSTVAYMEGYTNVASGTVLTTQAMPTLEYEVPYANSVRFSQVRRDNLNVSNEYGYISRINSLVKAGVTGSETVAHLVVHVAAGEDFQVFGFVGAPVLYDIV